MTRVEAAAVDLRADVRALQEALATDPPKAYRSEYKDITSKIDLAVYNLERRVAADATHREM